ncbi:hypothetical protein BN14_11901 [Rhizoctonia solani AG-1 IB]|uniref:Uncharacterized protein n=1 Tax=Thanatephorus cucumeris (strain AG1-IB / isolate 7/3/14) TaxID=1108050 RepID=M5CHE8_THACB|nr:hypothetical protein BN14_11901 [Rhizoctonia solani AG-1 IB]
MARIVITTDRAHATTGIPLHPTVTTPHPITLTLALEIVSARLHMINKGPVHILGILAESIIGTLLVLAPQADLGALAHLTSRRSRSESPKRSPKPEDPNDLPEPPSGWMDQDYYDNIYSSYYAGGKSRGGRKFIKVNGKATKDIDYSFLEKLKTNERKFKFVDKYGHPMARKLAIPHFNPYGYVPLDPKVVARIPRPPGDDWHLYVEVGAAGDYDWYLDTRSFIRSLVQHLMPPNAAEASITWKQFDSERRQTLYRLGYAGIPALYHFRDPTNKDCWFIAEIARDYLSGRKAYDPKRSPGTLKRRNETKLVENMKKRYTTPASKEEDPYYITAKATGKFDYTLDKKRGPLSKDRKDTPDSSKTTSQRDARRADKIVASEEARAKAATKTKALDPKPVKPGPSQVKSASKIQPAPKFKHQNMATLTEEEDDLDEELLRSTDFPPVSTLTKSPDKGPRMQLEVVMTSPSPVKGKKFKRPPMKPRRAPTADHTDEDLDNPISSSRKRMADKTPAESPTKQRRLIVEPEDEDEPEEPEEICRPRTTSVRSKVRIPSLYFICRSLI